MAAEIQEAMSRLAGRLAAASDPMPTGDAGARDAILAALSGLDLDPHELECWLSGMRTRARVMAASGIDVESIASGTARSALAVGLLIADARGREGR